MFGAFDPADGLSRPAFLTFMAIAAFGTLLTAAYLLTVVRRSAWATDAQDAPHLADVRPTSSRPGPRSSPSPSSPGCGPRPSSA